MNKISQGRIQEESRENKRKIDIFQDAFRKIKETTGVSDVNEVIQKIVSQEDTQNNLMELTKVRWRQPLVNGCDPTDHASS